MYINELFTKLCSRRGQCESLLTTVPFHCRASLESHKGERPWGIQGKGQKTRWLWETCGCVIPTTSRRGSIWGFLHICRNSQHEPSPIQRTEFGLTSALQTHEDPGAHERPKRDSSRRITARPLRRRPCGTTLATYPSPRRVRAVTSVRETVGLRRM